MFTSVDVAKLAEDFLHRRTKIPARANIKPKDLDKEKETDRMVKIVEALAAHIRSWGKKAKSDWCLAVQGLQLNDPVKRRVEKMDKACQRQFEQLKEIYGILNLTNVPPLKIMDDAGGRCIYTPVKWSEYPFPVGGTHCDTTRESIFTEQTQTNV